MFELMFFGMYAFVLLAAAVGVISSRNPVHSAMFLVLAFVTSAALWLLLEAEFLGIVLVLVYVGAVMVLFLYTEYVYPFELAAFILLLAIVAAIVLTMRKRPNLKKQDINAQVAVNRDDRLRIVKMKAETD
jgi:NADH-quinone oxidoreductase subunit J